MAKNSVRFYCLFLFAISHSLGAESKDLLDLWHHALHYNPDLAYSKAEYERAIYENEKSYAGFLPTVTAQASARQSSRNFTGSGTVNDPNSAANQAQGQSSGQEAGSSSNSGAVNRYSLGLTTNQNIFAGFKDRSTLDKTEALIVVAKQTLEDTKLRISYELRVAYSQVLYSKNLTALTEEILDRRKKNRNLVKLRYEGGREHKGSYLMSEAAVKQAEYDLEQATRTEEVNLAELKRILTSSIDQKKIQISGNLLKPTPPKETKWEEWVANHPQLMAEQAKVKAALAGVSVAESRFYPDVSISATMTRQDDVWLPKPRNYSFGLNFSYPIFNGGTDYYNVKIARTEHEKSIHQRDIKKNQLEYSLEQSYQALRNAIDNVDVLENYYQAAEVRAKIARSQYSNGLLSFENWDIIENDLINREKNLLSGKRDANLADATWLRNIGKSISDE
ncbi:TolC family protein [Leptospira idonii]|uniref:TolC family protein n=1 Tax=Leptospira idonii TaxID=1193500 RepID=A0A4R9LU36_9LEPT|nr:TolC family protein [Leptospira idonii]TGN17305.1 TolC family protein [Leptospira idonii]